jgi:hypothetical protein
VLDAAMEGKIQIDARIAGKPTIKITTVDGDSADARPGDWVIRRSNGILAVIKEQDFAMHYEAIPEESR